MSRYGVEMLDPNGKNILLQYSPMNKIGEIVCDQITGTSQSNSVPHKVYFPLRNGNTLFILGEAFDNYTDSLLRYFHIWVPIGANYVMYDQTSYSGRLPSNIKSYPVFEGRNI